MTSQVRRRSLLGGLLGTVVLGGACSSVSSAQDPTASNSLDSVTSPGSSSPSATSKGSVSEGTLTGPVVYLVPHQDDELISMVGGIVSELRAGADLHIRLVTDGGWSNLPKEMCQRKIACVDRDGLVKSRMMEMTESLAAMGVKEDRFKKLLVTEEPPGYPDRVIGAIDQMISEFGPTVRLRTMSWLDAHPGHFALGYVVDAAARDGRIAEGKFFQSPLYQVGSSLAKTPVPTPAGKKVEAPKDVVQKAIAAYRKFVPRHNRYSIGWLSVRNQLRWVAENHYSWMHDNSSAFTPENAKTAQQWTSAQHKPELIPKSNR